MTQVKGYTKADGTKVPAHTRKKKGSKKRSAGKYGVSKNGMVRGGKKGHGRVSMSAKRKYW